MARKSARTAEGAVAPVPVEVLSSTIVSPFSTLRAHLARALQEALLQLVARRAALPANALLSPLAPAQVQAIVDRVEESCEGLLRSEAAPGVEEEPWRRDCRRNIVYSALEELLFEVAMQQTEDTTTAEDDPAPFSLVFDVLDVILSFSEQDHVDTNLPITCIAALLEMQTIAGCFHIFAYLESRVERLTADMHPGRGKGLSLLRLLNDLLRRLPKSRTEHVIFCGRILLFLSSVFPLGEKSGVNLRGNFNLGKVTSFEEQLPKEDEQMEGESPSIEVEDFYTTFWSLQKYFTNPQSLFTFPPSAASSLDAPPTVKPSLKTAKPSDPSSPAPVASTSAALLPPPTPPIVPYERPVDGFPALRDGLTKTLAVFAAATQKEKELAGSSGSGVSSSSSSSVSSKRSDRGESKDGDAEDLENKSEYYFFPKFLTSRNLLELELADPSFRRQILVQTLVLFQYVLAFVPNGVLASSATFQKVGPVDEAWIASLRLGIVAELETMNPGGRAFKGTVELILRREQNWINWKLQSCPSIEKAPLSPDLSATAVGKLATLVKKPKSWPYKIGNPTLSKLWEGNLTSLSDYQRSTNDDSFDTLVRNWRMTNRLINQKNGQLNNARADPVTAKSPEGEERIQNILIESETLNRKVKVLHWRAVRIASTTHLHLFQLIKFGDLNLLIAAMDAERRKADEDAELRLELAEKGGTPPVEEEEEEVSLLGPPEVEEPEPIIKAPSETGSGTPPRVETPMQIDAEGTPPLPSRGGTPKLEDRGSTPVKRSRDAMDVDAEDVDVKGAKRPKEADI